MDQAVFPDSLKKEIERFARERGIAFDDALVSLIRSGLQHLPSASGGAGVKTPSDELMGLFPSDADAAMMDEIVEMVYRERRASARDAAA